MENEARLTLDVQYATRDRDVPSRADFRAWARAALAQGGAAVGLVIRVVDEGESRALNARYRGKNRATNVLSFAFEPPAGFESEHLGDVVICAPVVKREALEQGKKPTDHWAHMVVHGILHLRGYDHQREGEARQMESLEKRILEAMGIADPYGAAMEGKS